MCSYQCIVTYESQLLEDFSLCILEVRIKTLPNQLYCCMFVFVSMAKVWMAKACLTCASGWRHTVGVDFCAVNHAQKNNCLGMSAEAPKLPNVQPMSSFQVSFQLPGVAALHSDAYFACGAASAVLNGFAMCEDMIVARQQPECLVHVAQGAALTYELAERIFIGWLGKEKYSWRVVAGANTAYDKFPCQ